MSGNDGMTGPAVVLGGMQSPHDSYMQVAGHGLQDHYRAPSNAMETSKTLRNYLLLYVHTMVIQTASTALANGQADVSARMARWLLMVHDRTHGPEIVLTHEFLAVMLGVRRPWVTEILHVLEDKRLIRAKRGQITIVDRQGSCARGQRFLRGGRERVQATSGDKSGAISAWTRARGQASRGHPTIFSSPPPIPSYFVLSSCHRNSFW